MLNLKIELFNTFITQNSHHVLYFEKKNMLKQCQKEVIYEYILIFPVCWSIFWVVVGSG